MLHQMGSHDDVTQNKMEAGQIGSVGFEIFTVFVLTCRHFKRVEEEERFICEAGKART